MKSFLTKLSDTWKDFNSKAMLSTVPISCLLVEREKVEKIDEPRSDFFVFGTSINGDDTALLVEEGKIGLDAGYSVSRMPLADHLFISHHHQDHIGGLPSIGCRSIEQGKEVNIYIGRDLPQDTYEWIEDFKNENPDNKIKFHY